MRLKEQPSPALADVLLADTIWEDGILLQHDGSFLAAWQYRGPDMESATAPQLAAMAARLNDVLRLGSGWMLNADVIRTVAEGHSAEGHWPDPVSRMIEQERQRQSHAGTRFRSEYFLALTYLPPKPVFQRMLNWLRGGQYNEVIDLMEQNAAEFSATVGRFHDVIARELRAVRLHGHEATDQYGCTVVHDDLLRYVRRCVTGENHPVRRPDVPSRLNDTVLSTSLTVGDEPVLGDQDELAIVAIDGFAKQSYPTCLSALDELPFETRWSTRAIFLTAIDAVEALEKDRKAHASTKRSWFQSAFNSAKSADKPNAANMEADVKAAQVLAEEQVVQWCLYSCNVVLRGPDRTTLRKRVRRVVDAIQSSGYAAREERLNCSAAWLGTIPGDRTANVRRVKIHTLNLAEFLPITSIWEGAEHSSCELMPPKSPPLVQGETTGHTPFRFHPHVGNVGHLLGIGPSDSGKTTLAALMAAQWFRYADAQLVCFDYKHGMWLLCHAMGGAHYDLLSTTGKPLGFAPLAHLDSAADFAWAEKWIGDLCELNGLRLEPEHRNAIVAALRKLESGQKRYRSLSHFCMQLQDRDVQEAIRYYTMAGGAGQLFDALEDSVSWARLTVFEMQELFLTKNPRLIVPTFTYLFRCTERRLDGRPTAIVVDEAHAALSHPVVLPKIDEWFRTLRSRNGSLWMFTQQVSDFAKSAIADTVTSNAPTKIYLPNPEALATDTRGFYEGFNLSSRQIELIAGAIPQKHYYIATPQGSRMVDFTIGDVAKSFCAVNDKVGRRKFADLMERYPDSFNAEWLRLRGSADWADFLKEEQLCVSA